MEAARAIAAEALKKLSEYVDNVHIFCSHKRDGERGATAHFNMGHGNWYARYGQIKMWIRVEENIEVKELSTGSGEEGSQEVE